jgi:hypothetical protein
MLLLSQVLSKLKHCQCQLLRLQMHGWSGTKAAASTGRAQDPDSVSGACSAATSLERPKRRFQIMKAQHASALTTEQGPWKNWEDASSHAAKRTSYKRGETFG